MPAAPKSAVGRAQRREIQLFFDGRLYERDELAKTLSTTGSDADLVLAAYEKWGDSLVWRVRGIFVILLLDRAQGRLLLVRDPLGVWPVFYARIPDGWAISPSILALQSCPGVSTEINRAHLAERLMERWRRAEETPFRAIRRVPPGHLLRLDSGGQHLTRYWDPAPPGRPVRWIAEEQIPEFADLLDRAVGRCQGPGRTGIFLSGGLDSISVAVMAAERCAAGDQSLPIALSLVFPDPECNEESIQKSVASELGLPQVLEPFHRAAGAAGLLQAALELTGSWPMPLCNTWAPVYHHLALEGKKLGCRTILTGGGGDEWLCVSPALAADLILNLDVAGLARMLVNNHRSYPNPPLAMLRSTLWNFGLRPLLGLAAAWFLERWWPNGLHAYRRRRECRAIPDWLAPDPHLRKELEERAEWERDQPAQTSFYLREMHSLVAHPLMAMEMEEHFESGRRLGVQFLQPYWDADLVDFLFRTPPEILNWRGQAKGLVRQILARRFPGQAFVRDKKRGATGFFQRIMMEEGPRAWRRLGGLRALDQAGLVNGRRLEAIVEREDGRFPHLREILTLETWLRRWS
jgi:asparagine synthase (glutamine-hydrolysing)